MIRVGVLGATGRMGAIVCDAVTADPDLELAARLSRGGEVADLGAARTEVAVDFTHPDVVIANVRDCLAAGIHVVVGTSGFDAARLAEVRAMADGAGANVVVVPNFAIGAVLMQRFAAEAARHFADAEIVEAHHIGKADAPSGTAIATAERIAEHRRGSGAAGGASAARGADLGGVRVHSVRLPGIVAQQEVIFGGEGESLTIRHDTVDRRAFVPGILLAIRAVVGRRGLTVGLEPLLGLPPLA